MILKTGPIWDDAYLPLSDPRVIHPPRGIVLHDPEASSLEGLFATYAQTKLLPNYTVGRDGVVWVHLYPGNGRTFHVRAADRWRPGWLSYNPDTMPVSDVNRQCVGIEVLSGPSYRARREPYTAAQYTATAELVLTLRAQYEAELPLVTHGRLQLDRSDPVAWDWDSFDQALTRVAQQDSAEAELENVAALVEQLQKRIQALEADQQLCNALKAEFESLLRELERTRRLKRETTNKIIRRVRGY